jgi:D-serine dehydratase
MLHGTPQGRAYLQEHGLEPRMPQATHLVWTTGGLFVPDDEYQRFFNRGEACSASR